MNADLQQAIRQSLASPPNDPVIAFEGKWCDRAWLANMADAFDTLLGDASIVGLVARNRPAHVAACIANLAAGRTTSMIFAGGGASALALTIRTLRLPALIASRADWTSEALSAARETGTAAIAADDMDEPVTLQPGEVSLQPALARSDHALELLSSGTTGPPKRIGLSWHSVASAVADAGNAYTGTGASGAQVMVHPLGNVSGLAYAVPPLVHGQPLVLLEKFRAETWATAVRDYRPRRGAVPPAGIAMLLESDVPTAWLESLHLVAVGGGRLDARLHDKFENRYGIPVLTAYGATEFGGVIANWTLDEYRDVGRAKRGSAGRASRGVQLRIVIPDGHECPSGETGILEAKVARIGDGWIRTTDLARVDADGFLFIEGRADAAINRGGFKIVPEAVAEVLRAHPQVRDAVVIGLPDARLGEVPVAAVEAAAGGRADPAELERWLRDRLPPWQVPVKILVLDALLRTSTMKISLPEVRALFENRG